MWKQFTLQVRNYFSNQKFQLCQSHFLEGLFQILHHKKIKFSIMGNVCRIYFWQTVGKEISRIFLETSVRLVPGLSYTWTLQLELNERNQWQLPLFHTVVECDHLILESKLILFSWQFKTDWWESRLLRASQIYFWPAYINLSFNHELVLVRIYLSDSVNSYKPYFLVRLFLWAYDNIPRAWLRY